MRAQHVCTCLQALLNRGMHTILDIAGEAAGLGVWPRVHAFNVLRLAFQESKLAVSMTGFCAQGMCSLSCYT